MKYIKDIFAGNTVTIKVNGKKVQEIAEYPVLETVDGVTTFDIVVNFTDDNTIERVVNYYGGKKNERFHLEVLGDSEHQTLLSGYGYYIKKRYITGALDEVVRAVYTVTNE